MANGCEEAGNNSSAAERGRSPSASPSADRERAILLECRVEQLRAQLAEARAEADTARTRLAEATAQLAEQARRYSILHEELAQARADVATLHRRLDLSEALRTEAEGHLLEAGPVGDAEELVRLRREILAERHRSLVKDRAIARLRGRVDELLSSRDLLLTRVAEWQQLVREDKPEAADLSSYLSELRSEILELERRAAAGESREAALRERLALAGLDPEPLPRESQAPASAPGGQAAEPGTAASSTGTDRRPQPLIRDVRPVPTREPSERTAQGASKAVPEERPASEPPVGVPSVEGAGTQVPRDALAAALAKADVAAVRLELLRRIGTISDDELVGTIEAALESTEAPVRAAAYEALCRVLERDATRLEPYLRRGVADADARVRRRVVLAAAAARGVQLRPLLAPLREDSDPQVHRVVREVLRHTPEPAGQGDGAGPRADTGPARLVLPNVAAAP